MLKTGPWSDWAIQKEWTANASLIQYAYQLASNIFQMDPGIYIYIRYRLGLPYYYPSL